MIGPLFLPSNQFDHFYRGGDRIGALRDGPGGPMRPEEWIASTITRHGMKEQGLSVLPDGRYLRDAILEDPLAWLGAEHFEFFGTSTEILVKLLDPDQRLPVHFHPNKAFARQHLSLHHGKTEAWIVLEAAKGARVGLGFAKEMTKAQVLDMVKRQDSSALLKSLNSFEVEPGDAVFVPAGIPHAIDPGILILELQEPTDLSALLEWNDFAVDGTKDGHLGLGFETVLDALNLSSIEPEVLSTFKTTTQLENDRATPLLTSLADGYFRADLMPTGSRVSATFSVILVIAGEGILRTENAGSIAISHGDAIVVPYSAGEYEVIGVSAICCRPPRPEDTVKAP